MKYQLRAALAAIALTVLPGALFAGSASGRVHVKSFDADTHTVVGTTNGADIQKLRHTAATTHEFVADVFAFPPGPTRALVLAWNLAVFQNRPASTFDRLLEGAAVLGINLTIERSDKADATGSFELVKIAPSE